MMIPARVRMVAGVAGAVGWLLLAGPKTAGAGELVFDDAVVVTRPGGRGPAESMAATMLVEEVARRTGLQWPIQSDWPTDSRAVIALSTSDLPLSWTNRLPRHEGADRLPRHEGAGRPEVKAEGYSIRVEPAGVDGPVRAVVIGADGRGVMYGAGRLLRTLRCSPGQARLDGPLDIASAPAYPLRGHQLGYRARANSYDAWTPEQYEQYIRELAVFGANCIENIPFEDQQQSVVMPVAREEMNRRLSEICARYDLDYWVWTPADFPLSNESRRRAALAEHETLYRSCVRLDAVFFPGGDPGDNPPDAVIAFLKDLAGLLARHHPRARIWVSMQGFDAAKASDFLDFVAREKPTWLGGVVAGPSSPPMGETRRRLPREHRLRWYPDITHTVRCQYPVEWWDPAFALTLGREPPNPRPADYATIFRRYAPWTDGFLTYSDGIHDDVNKAVWSLLGWDPESDVREMLVEYARLFFGADVADEGADALLGLEDNWRGSLALNAGADGVLALWQRLEARAPRLRDHWRFQLHLLRAYYDAYTRHRLIYETHLEREAMLALARARQITADRAMDAALEVLRRVDTEPCRPEWRARIEVLAEALFASIGYQTSMARYHASGGERGCIMDFLDHPLNNRWWLEDQFAEIGGMDSEDGKLARLEVIRTWADPGPGGLYDEVGHVGRSPRVVRGEGTNTDPEASRDELPEHAWWDDGKSRRRLSWQHYIPRPVAVSYEGLDPGASYILGMTGQGEARPRADGVALEASAYSTKIGEFKEFPVPADLTRDGQLRVTWDAIDESHLNWRHRSHVTEVWMLKR